LYNAAKALSCRNMRTAVLKRRRLGNGDGANPPLHQFHFPDDAFALVEGVPALHPFADNAAPKESDGTGNRSQA